MKATVDADLCTGCGLCVDLAPSVFELGDDVAKVIVAKVPPDDEDACREAAESCPVEAIGIVE
ncbi:MAG TPA: ferredoxin [archaeon]|nr:ferredoxin [archaeon]